MHRRLAMGLAAIAALAAGCQPYALSDRTLYGGPCPPIRGFSPASYHGALTSPTAGTSGSDAAQTPAPPIGVPAQASPGQVVTGPSSRPPEVGRTADQIPSGEACLRELEAQGVAFRSLDPQKGVETPVVANGPLGNVLYWAHGDVPLIGDCRLLLVLHWLGPTLIHLGVEKVQFSGAYVYRKTAGTNRLSYHAHGLAIDIHGITVDGRDLSVKGDYLLAIHEPCDVDSPMMNRIACELGESGLFREVLTPDRDAAHHDHFHFGVRKSN